MDTHQFEAQLRSDGYLDIKARTLDPTASTNSHSHLFDTRLLVLDGEVTISGQGQQRTYQAGDVLEIQRQVEHSESYGSTRFQFIAGLRHTQATS